MKKNPTDLEILTTIYDNYYNTFSSYSLEDKTRSTKVYVPIDLEKIAKDLDADEFLLFGRLYNFLDQKYGYKNDDVSNSRVRLFSMKVGDDKNCIHFPLLASILAQLQSEDKKYQRATILSVISATVSILSLLIALTSLIINFNKK